jgi:glycosyltransferase involved in cell wall biosynthesis
MKKLQRLAEKLGIADHVQFLGQLPQDQVALWMNAADCLVLPSKSEGTPNVVLEALACGTPVVATPVGEVPFLVKDGVNGYVVEQDTDVDDRRTQGPQDHGTTGPQDQLTPSQQKIAKTAKDADDLVQHLAEAIDKVLDRDWDRETIAAAVADFTWDRTAETILNEIKTTNNTNEHE